MADRDGGRAGLRGRTAPDPRAGRPWPDIGNRAHTAPACRLRGRSPAAQAPIRKGSSLMSRVRAALVLLIVLLVTSGCFMGRLVQGPTRRPGRLARAGRLGRAHAAATRDTGTHRHAGAPRHRRRPTPTPRHHPGAERHRSAAARHPHPQAPAAARTPPRPTRTWRAWSVAPPTSRWTSWRASSAPAMPPTSCWVRRRSPRRSRCCTPAPAARPRPRSRTSWASTCRPTA